MARFVLWRIEKMSYSSWIQYKKLARFVSESLAVRKKKKKNFMYT